MDPFVVALVSGPLTALVAGWVGHRLGRRRESALVRRDEAEAGVADVDAAGAVATLWREWSEQQGKRITALESRVCSLEDALAEAQQAARSKDETIARRDATIARQKFLLTALIRWSLQLRDAVLRAGGTVPPAPVEVETTLTTLDPS